MTENLTERISVLEATKVPDGGGGFDVDWTIISTHWAEIIWRSSKINNSGFKRRLLKRALCRLRTGSQITSDHRVKIDSDIYRLTSLRPETDNRKYSILNLEEVIS